MLSSKEALEKVIEDISLEWGYEGIEDELREKLKPLYEDLDRLEDLENELNAFGVWNKIIFKENKKFRKVIEILKNKKVNIFHIWVFDDYEQYKEHYPFAEYNAEEDMLTFEEFDLLKGILNDEQ